MPRHPLLLVVFTGLLSAPDLRAAGAVPVLPRGTLPAARQPQAAVDPSGKVYVVLGAGDAVYCVASADGKSFSDPVKVGDAGSLALGMRRGPRVAATEKGVVVTAIGGKAGKGKDGDLLSWRSSDGGKTWKGPELVNSAADSAREGLHGMAAGPDGSVYCVWLDLRSKRMEVYGARSDDGGKTWRDEKRVYASPDGHVCTCCQPSVAFDPNGGLHVLWRNDLAGARDMYLCSSSDGGRTFGNAVKLGKGTWPLTRCPMDGGGLAGDDTGAVQTIWRREKEIFRCDAGKDEELLGRGEQGWAAFGPGGFYLAWIEARHGALRARVPGDVVPAVLSATASDPCVAAAPTGKGPVVVVWEEGKHGALTLRAAFLSPGR